MRRQKQTPMDMIPIMGLMTLLIPMLLMNQANGPAVSTVDTNLPSCCSGGSTEVDETVTPNVMLGVQHIRVDGVNGDRAASFEPDDLEGLSEHLKTLTERHPTNGNAIIVTDSAVQYDRLIQVMDTVRPHFPSSTLAGGVM